MRDFTVRGTREDYTDLIIEMSNYEWKGHTTFSTKPHPHNPKGEICITWKSTNDEDFFKIFNLYSEIRQR